MQRNPFPCRAPAARAAHASLKRVRSRPPNRRRARAGEVSSQRSPRSSAADPSRIKIGHHFIAVRWRPLLGARSLGRRRHVRAAHSGALAAIDEKLLPRQLRRPRLRRRACARVRFAALASGPVRGWCARLLPLCAALKRRASYRLAPRQSSSRRISHAQATGRGVVSPRSRAPAGHRRKSVTATCWHPCC